LWIILAITLSIGGIFSMPFLGICPPDGPWPTPPWCVSKLDCVDYPPNVIDEIVRDLSDRIGAENLEIANGCMFMRSFGDNDFQAFDPMGLAYLKGAEDYPPIERDISFGVSPIDYWGNNYIIPRGIEDAIPELARNLWNSYADLGTDTRRHNNLENTIKRSAQIGAEYFMVIDFIMIADDDLTRVRSDFPGTEAMTQNDMNRIAELAHGSNLEAVLQLTSLDTSFFDQLADYFNSGQDGSLYDVLDHPLRYNPYNAGEDTLVLHEGWRMAILEEARMAEAAGFDRLLVTDGTFWINTGEFLEQDNAEWKETISAIRKVFSGKLGAGAFDMIASYSGYNYFSELDFVILTIGSEQITSGYRVEQIDEITASWQSYLLSPKMKEFEGIPEVIQSLSVSSYDSVLENGWIEAGGHYPDLKSDYPVQAVVHEAFFRALYETPTSPVNSIMTWGYNWHDYIYPNQHEIRDDLSNSIRGKDAESVFFLWSTIFQ